jgi:hypothetical protein
MVSAALYAQHGRAHLGHRSSWRGRYCMRSKLELMLKGDRRVHLVRYDCPLITPDALFRYMAYTDNSR